jgi:hypothetical protein
MAESLGNFKGVVDLTEGVEVPLALFGGDVVGEMIDGEGGGAGVADFEFEGDQV